MAAKAEVEAEAKVELRLVDGALKPWPRAKGDLVVERQPMKANLPGTAEPARAARGNGETVGYHRPAQTASCPRGSSIGQSLSAQEIGLPLPWLRDRPLNWLDETERSCKISGGLPANLEEDLEAAKDRNKANAKAVAER